MYICIYMQAFLYQCISTSTYLLENPLSLLGAGEGVSVENNRQGIITLHLERGHQIHMYMLQTEMLLEKYL